MGKNVLHLCLFSISFDISFWYDITGGLFKREVYMGITLSIVGSLRLTFVPARRMGLAVKLPFAFALEGQFSVRPEKTFAGLCYLFEGLRPIETIYLRLSLSP